jgi:DnaJ-class molecular chaperone
MDLVTYPNQLHKTMAFFPGGGHQFFSSGFPGGLPPGLNVRLGGGFPPPDGRRGAPKESDHYKTLAVSPNCEASEIKKAFRRLSMTYHPDKNDGNDVRYKEVTAAYEVLSDPEKRMCYDAYGPDFAKLPFLDQFLQSVKHEDLVVQVDVTLKECLSGAEKQVRYHRRAEHGNTEVAEHRFFLNPGCANKSRMTFPSMGHREPSKLQGSLVVVVNEQPTENFERQGGILVHRLQATYAEAISGKLKVKHPIKPFVIFRKKGFVPEQWYRIEGRGATAKDPMFIQVKVVWPAMNPELRSKLLLVFNYQMPAYTDEEQMEAPNVKPESVQRALQEQAVSSAQEEQHNGGESGPHVQQCPVQ